MKKIGILGSGIVAQTLANGFIHHGFQVTLGTRDESKLTDWKKQAGEHGKTGSFKEAALFGEILILAVKGTAAKDVLNLAGSANLKGKTVIDTTNPIADVPPDNGVLKFFTSLDHALMEDLQKAFPDSNFVKAFNCIGNAFMVNPKFSQKPTMFICGNDVKAKKEVSDILDLFGHDVADMGGVQSARAIEPLCMLWCIPGLQKNEWSHAFRLIH
jgi:8-hydroxy-5-deazaflavin:NADPH oxidoreductase